MIKANMVFSVQEDGSFHIINNGTKVGTLSKPAGSDVWYIDRDNSSVRFAPFDTAAEAKKYATNNRGAF